MNNKVQKTKRILPNGLLATISGASNSLTDIFIKLKLSPNTISVIALIVGLGAGILFAFGKPIGAAVLIIFCGFFDVMDGKVAAKTNRKSLFGAIFDSTLDRYSEFFIYLGLAVYLRNHWALWITFWTFLGSSMVSYTRARAEGLGIECKVGIMQRVERMVLLTAGAIVGAVFDILVPVLIGVLGTIAVISNISALQRTFYVKKIEKMKKSGI